MKLTLSVEFDSVEEYLAVGEAFISAGLKNAGEDKPKVTRKAKEKDAPNDAKGGVTSGNAGPASPSLAAVADNPLEGLTGGGDSGISDLDQLLNGTTEPAKVVKLTREDVRAKAGAISAAGGKDTTTAIVKLIQSYGAKSVSDFTDAQLIDFDAKLDKLKK